MKSILLIVCGMLTLVFSTAYAQEAHIERVHIYEDVHGIVYRNEAFYINEDISPIHIKKSDSTPCPDKNRCASGCIL